MQILKAATYKAINVTINHRQPEFETATMHQQTHSCRVNTYVMPKNILEHTGRWMTHLVHYSALKLTCVFQF